MARADKEFFIRFRKEIMNDNSDIDRLELLKCPTLYTAASIPKGSLVSIPADRSQEVEKEKAYDEICRQNIELSNEVAALKKANHELQNKLDALQSTNQGEPENVISFESFIRYINDSFDEEEIKATRNLGRLFFDGEAKKQINKQANDRLADLKAPRNVNNYHAPVGQVGENIQNNQIVKP